MALRDKRHACRRQLVRPGGDVEKVVLSADRSYEPKELLHGISWSGRKSPLNYRQGFLVTDETAF